MEPSERIERRLERSLFAARWLMAPFFIGLVIALAILLLKFFQELWHVVPTMFSVTSGSIILAVLSLVDLTLVASLLLMIILAGYENFVSRIETEEIADRPEWMGHVDFSDLKLKVVSSIVAISAIQLLAAFLEIDEVDFETLMWLIILHLTFVVSGVFLALMDWIAGLGNKKH
ncbi:MAG: TIGR00645 family protein [Alphaproteobacteria bacterium]|nr:TIGR00645 family protein [Alphaproteobacteria bacterium]